MAACHYRRAALEIPQEKGEEEFSVAPAPQMSVTILCYTRGLQSQYCEVGAGLSKLGN